MSGRGGIRILDQFQSFLNDKALLAPSQLDMTDKGQANVSYQARPPSHEKIERLSKSSIILNCVKRMIKIKIINSIYV